MRANATQPRRWGKTVESTGTMERNVNFEDQLSSGYALEALHVISDLSGCDTQPPACIRGYYGTAPRNTFRDFGRL